MPGLHQSDRKGLLYPDTTFQIFGDKGEEVIN